MKGKRTGIDFSKHELVTFEHENVKIHHIKKPNTSVDNIKYINTGGVMAVTGDYGNWIFCREFHPASEVGVSGHYWIEKLKIASCQEPFKYCSESTEKAIKTRIAELEEIGYEGKSLEDMKEYYENCLESVEDEYSYIEVARDYPRWTDSESAIIFEKGENYSLNAVFDGFDEICRRLKEKADVPTT